MKKNIWVYVIGLATMLASCTKDPVSPQDKLPTVITCGDLSSERVLRNDPDKDIDYIVDCVVSVTARISVEPGTVIRFEDEAGFAVVSGGSLSARGTASEPIVFTSRTKQKGAWKGLYFESSSINNVLDFCRVEYAGGSAFNSNDDKAALVIWAGSRVNVSNTEIWRSDNYGISMSYSGVNASFSDNKISETKGAAAICLPNNVVLFDGSNDFTGNDRNYVQLSGSNFTGDLILKKLNVPYRFSNVGFPFNYLIADGHLAIEAGAVMEFESPMGLTVTPSARITINGTANDPVIMRGVDNAPGSWHGIYVDRSNLNNIIEHSIISDAGDGSDIGAGAISMWGNPRLTVRQTEFRNIELCAFYNFAGPENPNLTLIDNVFTNVSGGTLCHD